jgi:hypothetical protein
MRWRAACCGGEARGCGWMGCRSRAGAEFGRRARLIRERVIGHGMRGLVPPVAGRRLLVVAHWGQRALALLAGRGTLALLHQPARQHGRAVFFEPGIQQLVISLRRLAAWLSRESS